jgi:hypothetical protein
LDPRLGGFAAPRCAGHCGSVTSSKGDPIRLAWRPRPIHAAAEKAKEVHELELAGESEWTPWIAIAAVILFFGAIGVLIFGVIEAGSHLVASASS